MKYKKGDVVQVRNDLIIGNQYFHENSKIYDVFSSRMRNNLGKEAKIVGILEGKYLLDIDSIHTFTDGMLQEPVDKLAKTPYEFNFDVERIVEHMLKLMPEQLINNAIDKGDRELFKTLSEKYYNVSQE